jgi:glucose/mannose transport system substrate-binding protein
VLAGIALGAPPSVSAASAAPDLPQSAGPLVLYHWWSSPSEMAALDALSDVVKARYPGFAEKRMPAPADRGGGLFAILQNLAKAGKAPDLVTMTTGYSMKPFVDAGLVARLDDLWISERLEKVVPAGIQAVNAFEGHYYSAPLDIHRTNLVWYNKKLLDKHGIDPASLTTLERFFDAAGRLRAGGVGAPIQMATTWTTVQVFEGLMVGQGTAAYQDWVNGKIRSASDPRLLQALSALKQYLSFANRDSAGLDWLVALRRVAAGESAFYWMGDWANGDFRAAGLVYGKDYGVIVAPGTSGLYGASIDAFVKPLGSAQPESANRWLRVASSREGQDAFNALKGSIPARRDPNLARYDAYQKWAIASFKASRPYPIATAALPVPYVRALSAVLAAFVVDGDVRRAAEALVAATANSAFTRVWSPE